MAKQPTLSVYEDLYLIVFNSYTWIWNQKNMCDPQSEKSYNPHDIGTTLPQKNGDNDDV